MAFVAHTHTELAERPSILSRIGAFFIAYAEARSRRSEIDSLERLTDDELAARGLTRDSIMRHVFADTFYL